MTSRSPTRIGRRRERASSDAKTGAPPAVTAPITPPAEAQPVVHPEFADESRDLTLISSDNVIFHVDSFYPLAHRRVFSTCPKRAHSDYSVIWHILLLELEPSDGVKTIRFDDPVLEDSKVVSLLLDTVCFPYRDAFTVQVREGNFVPGGVCEKAFRLAGKYDCPFLQQSMLRSVIHCLAMEPYYLPDPDLLAANATRAVSSSEGANTTEDTERRPRVDVVLAFVLAAEQNMTGECVQLLLDLQARQDHAGQGAGIRALHPARLSKDLAKRLPFDIFWALQTAFTGISAEVSTLASMRIHENIAARFVGALTDGARSIRGQQREENVETTGESTADGEAAPEVVNGAKRPPSTATPKANKPRGLFASLRRNKETQSC